MTYSGAGVGLVLKDNVDLSDRIIRYEEDSRHSQTDPLTGIGNLRRFKARTEKLIAEREGDPAPFSLGIFNIDHFRPVNDLFGRKAGDEILAQVALRIEAALPENATLVRIAGDTFGMILPTCFFEHDAEDAGQLLKDVLAAPFDVGERTVRMSASFGFCQYPFAGTTFDELLDRCETALYRAKKAGGCRVKVYTGDLAAEMRQRTRTEQALRKAVAAEDVHPHFQPIVNLSSGAIVGFESLARWTDPELGPVSPGDFIPLAEQAGIIDSIQRLLFRQAIECARDWPAEVFLSINLSPVQLVDQTTSRAIIRIMEKTKFDPGRLVVEITETAIVSDPDTAGAIIDDLRAEGISIALDDFGTGQSSLGRIRDFAFDKVKIDRAFVSSMDEDERSGHIVQAILNMCAGLGLDVIAEGIETAEQAKALTGLGCTTGQGFHFGRPMSAADTARFLAENEVAGANRERGAKAAPCKSGHSGTGRGRSAPCATAL